MKSKQETFASLMESFRYRYDLRTVFEDFLTMTMCAVTRNPLTGLSHYENLYLETVAKYKEHNLRFQFPALYATLVLEMEERFDDSKGNDVLGEYFELSFCQKNSGQFFTPWSLCKMMGQMLGEKEQKELDRPLRILDPSCGSGRTLLAGAKNFGSEQEYYGIDIDHTCVKMTALNLFLNGIFHSEVMCADALSPDDFRISYAISLLPFGIFRIKQKEKSRLWHMHRNSFEKKQPVIPVVDLKLPSESGEIQKSSASQLQLF